MKGRRASVSDSPTGRVDSFDAGTGDRVRVLLVGADPDDARRTRAAFETVSTETAIDVVADGEEALEFLQHRIAESSPVPDLVLLDLSTGTDGLEFLEAVRNDSTLGHVPVLVLVNPEATADVRESYERAANACLAKPSDPDAFETIATAIENFWFWRASLPSIRS